MHRIPFFKPGLLASAALCSLLSAEGARQTSLSLDGGTVTFDVGTNISAVSVHGKSSNVRGLARLRKEGAQLILEDVAATLPVEALTTGMSLRDDHMKKYIFTTADQKLPELKFTGSNMACPVDAGGDGSCKITGKMTIRGVEKPLTVALKVKAGAAYRAILDGAIKLSDYGIERPSQFGVKCADDVKIHIELAGKETVESSATRAGGEK